MGTKLRKLNDAWFGAVFIVCVSTFIIFIVGATVCVALYESNGLFYGGIWALFFPSEYGDYYTSLWQNHGAELTLLRDQISIFLGVSIVAGILSLVSFIYLCAAVGRRDESGSVILKGVDKIYTEIQLVIIFAMFVAGGAIFIRAALSVSMNILAIRELINKRTFMITFYEPTAFVAVLTFVVGLGAASVGLWMILSCVRKIKARCFLKQSIIGKIFMLLYDAVYRGGSVMRKAVLAAALICIFSATVVLAPVVLILIVVLVPRWVRKYEEVKRGVEEVKSGNLTYKIPISGNGELDRLAIGINEISQSSNIAVQNELKNQRMKTELISNVSHDLRTPLTSMVTYIDLLKTEGLTGENAPEYLNILDQKTNRLRQLTDDLFEAAKASSGAIPVRMEKVDMLSLVNQGLGEMDQRISDSGLDFIVNTESEKYYVWADGQLLWRVVENLLGNILKYAQEHTRVYIDISEQGYSEKSGGMVILEIKNISKQALNINADELLERFKRGDESRSTEGSGLGLTIAKDLVKLQNGWLDIKIDGDLFKTTVMLKKAE